MNPNPRRESISPRDVSFDSDNETHYVTDELTRGQAWCLYLSHFLSMWTSRTYEYIAIWCIQRTFPGDLLPSSINGIAETLCVLVSSAALGRWIDRSPTRLRPLLISILANRSTLVLCCILWIIIFISSSSTAHQILFALILLLGMVEKVTRMSNTLSVMRDWVPTMASRIEPGSAAHQSAYTLTHLNTIISRIDIVCKFVSPLTIAGVIVSVQPWFVALLVGFTGALSCAVEVWGILFVWKSNRRLRETKPDLPSTKPETEWPSTSTGHLMHIMRNLGVLFRIQIEGLQYFFSTNVWIPSLGVALLHSSVLAWSGTLITWLLNCGFSYGEVTVGKAFGSIFEIGSTFVFSWSVTFFTNRMAAQGAYQTVDTEDDDNDNVEQSEDGDSEQATDQNSQVNEVLNANTSPIIITAKYSITSLTICLIPTLAALFILDRTLTTDDDEMSSASSPFRNSPAPSAVFLIFLSFSFIGRWTYDLCITQLQQIAIPARRRSEFGGTEMAIVSLVSLGHWVAAAVWHRQQDFKWLAVGSVVAVAVAAASYVFWALAGGTGSERRGKSVRMRNLGLC